MYGKEEGRRIGSRDEGCAKCVEMAYALMLFFPNTLIYIAYLFSFFVQAQNTTRFKILLAFSYLYLIFIFVPFYTRVHLCYLRALTHTYVHTFHIFQSRMETANARTTESVHQHGPRDGIFKTKNLEKLAVITDTNTRPDMSVRVGLWQSRIDLTKASKYNTEEAKAHKDKSKDTKDKNKNNKSSVTQCNSSKKDEKVVSSSDAKQVLKTAESSTPSSESSRGEHTENPGVGIARRKDKDKDKDKHKHKDKDKDKDKHKHAKKLGNGASLKTKGKHNDTCDITTGQHQPVTSANSSESEIEDISCAEDSPSTSDTAASEYVTTTDPFCKDRSRSELTPVMEESDPETDTDPTLTRSSSGACSVTFGNACVRVKVENQRRNSLTSVEVTHRLDRKCGKHGSPLRNCASSRQQQQRMSEYRVSPLAGVARIASDPRVDEDVDAEATADTDCESVNTSSSCVHAPNTSRRSGQLEERTKEFIQDIETDALNKSLQRMSTKLEEISVDKFSDTEHTLTKAELVNMVLSKPGETNLELWFVSNHESFTTTFAEFYPYVITPKELSNLLLKEIEMPDKPRILAALNLLKKLVDGSLGSSHWLKKGEDGRKLIELVLSKEFMYSDCNDLKEQLRSYFNRRASNYTSSGGGRARMVARASKVACAVDVETASKPKMVEFLRDTIMTENPKRVARSLTNLEWDTFRSVRIMEFLFDNHRNNFISVNLARWTHLYDTHINMFNEMFENMTHLETQTALNKLLDLGLALSQCNNFSGMSQILYVVNEQIDAKKPTKTPEMRKRSTMLRYTVDSFKMDLFMALCDLLPDEAVSNKSPDAAPSMYYQRISEIKSGAIILHPGELIHRIETINNMPQYTKADEKKNDMDRRLSGNKILALHQLVEDILRAQSKLTPLSMNENLELKFGKFYELYSVH